MIRKVIYLNLVLLLLLQLSLWNPETGFPKVTYLKDQVAIQEKVNQGLHRRNRELEREVLSLKNDWSAVEEKARLELGMIKQDEVYVQIVQ
jgi:cell division protein FtsB